MIDVSTTRNTYPARYLDPMKQPPACTHSFTQSLTLVPEARHQHDDARAPKPMTADCGRQA
jgi:hypothetical protein